VERFFTWKKRNKTPGQAQQGAIPPPAAGAAAPNNAATTHYTSPPPQPATTTLNSSGTAAATSAASAQLSNSLNASNSLLSEILAIIDSSKNVTIIDSPKTSVFQDLAELKQSCDAARSALQQLSKNPTVLPGPHVLDTLNHTMQEIRKVLFALEKAVPNDFWHNTKVRVYQLDFLLKMQSDQINLALSTNDYSSLITTADGKKWWSTAFGDHVRFEKTFFFFFFFLTIPRPATFGETPAQLRHTA
jgi:hypothetical protein